MKILDRYIAKNFIIGYIIAFTVLIGLCVVIDLFVSLDEFAEHHADLGTFAVLKNIYNYYSIQCTLWFRDLAGMITVIAAVFSLARLTRKNELIAVMASGVSLKRVIAPIVILAILLTALLVIDQEIVIPRLATKLIRKHDERPGYELYDISFMSDNKSSLLCTSRYDERTVTMFSPVIIIREPAAEQNGAKGWRVVGKIQADSAKYNYKTKGWDLENGRLLRIYNAAQQPRMNQQTEPVAFYQSDITPQRIPMKRQEGHKSLLSSTQLAAMAQQEPARLKDAAELYFQKHSRITDPIINMVMLIIALPVLVCRDPKTMISAILASFGLTSLCFIATFICKMFATEVFFNQIRPEFWAWAPIFIFLPIAFIELDSMKT